MATPQVGACAIRVYSLHSIWLLPGHHVAEGPAILGRRPFLRLGMTAVEDVGTAGSYPRKSVSAAEHDPVYSYDASGEVEPSGVKAEVCRWTCSDRSEE